MALIQHSTNASNTFISLHLEKRNQCEHNFRQLVRTYLTSWGGEFHLKANNYKIKATGHYRELFIIHFIRIFSSLDIKKMGYRRYGVRSQSRVCFRLNVNVSDSTNARLMTDNFFYHCLFLLSPPYTVKRKLFYVSYVND